MALAKHHRTNFNTLLRAAADGHMALMEVQDKATGKEVAAIVMVGSDGTDYTFTPVALMIEGNPFELFNPPLPEGGFATD